MGNTPELARTISINLILIVLSAVLITFALWILRPPLAATSHLSTGESKPLEYMPWVFSDATNGNRLSVTMPVNWLTPTTWRVVPDDELTSLTINGTSVSLQAIPGAARTDWNKGFVFDFSPWLKHGENLIEFEVNNHGGPGGLSLHPISGARWLLLWFSFLPLLLLLSRLFKLRLHQFLPIALGLALICSYWSVTPWTTRAHDVWGGDGHIDYVIRLAHTLTLPGPNERWEFFQPPLYYIGGAVAWRWAEWLQISAPETVQAYSLVLWIIFLCASSAMASLALRFRATSTFIATTAIALWPTGIISSVAINNDVGFYACSSLATFFIAKWWLSSKRGYLLAASAFVALALLTKSTALVLVGTLGILMVIRLMRHHQWRHWQTWQAYLSCGGIILCGFSMGIGRKLYYYWQGSVSNWLTGDNALLLGDWLKVPAQIGNFIPLDLATFLSYPWADLTNDAHGRNNFWNLLLRTSLTGEYTFDGVLQKWIAFLWGALLVTLLVIVVSQWKRLRVNGNAWRHAPLLIISLLWIASLLSFRIQASYSCNNDFRYLLPILIPLSIACASSGKLARTLVTTIAVGSILFFSTLKYGL